MDKRNGYIKIDIFLTGKDKLQNFMNNFRGNICYTTERITIFYNTNNSICVV